MIAAGTASFALDKLPFGWFDAVLVAVLVFGFFHGRKQGLTKEILPMLHALATVLVCGLGYQAVGTLIINSTKYQKATAYILGYLGLAFLVFLGYRLAQKLFTRWLTGSNVFGSGEYYLGMLAGMIRFVSLLFCGLALLNAPYYTSADIKSRQAYVDRWFGADYFPGMQEVQESVFNKSLLGPYIKEFAGVLLIDTTPPGIKRTAAPVLIKNL